MAPAGLNVLIVLIAIGLAVAAGAVLAVIDIRTSSRPAPHVESEPTEQLQVDRRAA